MISIPNNTTATNNSTMNNNSTTSISTSIESIGKLCNNQNLNNEMNKNNIINNSNIPSLINTENQQSAAGINLQNYSSGILPTFLSCCIMGSFNNPEQQNQLDQIQEIKQFNNFVPLNNNDKIIYQKNSSSFYNSKIINNNSTTMNSFTNNSSFNKSFAYLPYRMRFTEELFQIVLSYINEGHQVLTLSLVCKNWRKIAFNDLGIWHSLCSYKWSWIKQMHSFNNVNWRSIYFSMIKNYREMNSEFSNGKFFYSGQAKRDLSIRNIIKRRVYFKEGIGYERCEYTRGKYRGTYQYYYGNWKNDKKNGKGIMLYDGKIYEGEWLNDEIHGFGKLVYPDYTYTGEFRNGKIDGYGRLVRHELVYEGEFKLGKMNGRGFIKWTKDYHHKQPNRIIIVFSADRVFEGEFRNGALVRIVNGETLTVSTGVWSIYRNSSIISTSAKIPPPYISNLSQIPDISNKDKQKPPPYDEHQNQLKKKDVSRLP